MAAATTTTGFWRRITRPFSLEFPVGSAHPKYSYKNGSAYVS